MLELGNTSIPRAPFSMLCSFAIKFDESGCFDLKLNIDRGGWREENIQTTIFTYNRRCPNLKVIVCAHDKLTAYKYGSNEEATLPTYRVKYYV